jgi:hypothetical protein
MGEFVYVIELESSGTSKGEQMKKKQQTKTGRPRE